MNAKRIALLIMIALLGAGLSSQTVFAQTDEPADAETWMGQVSGTLVNMNEAETATEGIELMLHGWDSENEQTIMLHGELNADGSFEFSEVPFEDGLLLSVMATYREAIYYSEPVMVSPGEEAIAVEVPVYETKNDLAGLQIDQVYVLFYFQQGKLEVTELYVLSNLSDRAIRDAVTWDDSGRTATLVYALPESAVNIRFNTQNQERFVVVPGGFADTVPLAPGESSSNVMVTYEIPYDGGQTFTLAPPVAAADINFLLDSEAGVELLSTDLVDHGVQTFQNGARFAMYVAEKLDANEVLQIQLIGEPQAIARNADAGMGEVVENPGIGTRGQAIGSGLLGLALIGVGVWWIRRRDGDPDEDWGGAQVEPGGDRWDDLIGEIARLDQAFEDGRLSESEHRDLRAPLMKDAGMRLALRSEMENTGE